MSSVFYIVHCNNHSWYKLKQSRFFVHSGTSQRWHLFLVLAMWPALVFIFRSEQYLHGLSLPSNVFTTTWPCVSNCRILARCHSNCSAWDKDGYICAAICWSFGISERRKRNRLSFHYCGPPRKHHAYDKAYIWLPTNHKEWQQISTLQNSIKRPLISVYICQIVWSGMFPSCKFT